MKSYLKIFFWLMLLSGFVNAYSWTDFSISTNNYFVGLTEISVNTNLSDASTVTLEIWGESMKFKWAEWSKFTFTVPSDFTLSSSNLKTVVSINGSSYDSFDWPYLSSVDKTKDWNDLLVNWTFTWTCILNLSDWTDLNLFASGGSYYASLPTDLQNTIDWWNLICDGMASNYVEMEVSNPELFYIKAVDDGIIQPWEQVILKWRNLKTTDNDTVSLTYDGKEITQYNIIDSQTIYLTLPNENINNKKIELKVNNKESNDLYVKALSYPEISNVSYEYQNTKYVIKIDWNFDYTLWDLAVYYGSNKLTVVKTWSNYIYAAFPTVTREKNSSWTDILSKFSCNYYFTPDNIRVDIWSVSSNKFFTYLDIVPRIKSVQTPYCDSTSCYVTFYVDNLSKWRQVKVKYNWTEYEVYKNESNSKITIDTDNLVKDGKLEIYTDECLYSQTFRFDYSRELKPKIFKIEGNGFKSWWSFTIYWENFTNVMWTNVSELSIWFSPDYISKNSSNVPILTKWQSEVKWTITMPGNVQTWQNISVTLSNKMWTSNGLTFQTDSSKTMYLWNPEIYFISFPDWFDAGKTAIIQWVWFSEKCGENQVYFEQVKTVPTKCSYKSLTVTIPDQESNEIKVVRWDLTSNIYKLNFIFWLSGSVDNFELTSDSQTLKKKLQKDTSVEFSLTWINTLWNVYMDKLYINFEWTDYMPFSNFKISIWDDARRYIYTASSRELIKTDEEAVWYLKKVWEKKYQLVFDNLYIPYAKDGINIKITATLDPNYTNTSDINFYLPEQNVSYNLMYWENKKYSMDIANIDMGKVSLVWGIWSKCFAADGYESYCDDEDSDTQETADEETTTTEETTEDSTEEEATTWDVLTWTDTINESGSLVSQYNDARYLKLSKKLDKETLDKVYNIFVKYTNVLRKKYNNNEMIQKLDSINANIQYLTNKLDEDNSKIDLAKDIYDYIFCSRLAKDLNNLTKTGGSYEEKYLKLANKMDENYMKNMNITLEKMLSLYISTISTDNNVKTLYDKYSSMKLLETETALKIKLLYAQKMYEFNDIYKKVKWSNK